MERLTDKNHNAINKCSEYSSCYSCHKENCYIKEIEEKLGELEDVLEKFNIGYAAQLDSILTVNRTNTLIDIENKEILELENTNLKSELAELKQKAIVLEKAFKLACDPRDDWGGEKYSGTEFNNYHDYFIAEAEQKLAEIGGKDE